jgi:hypothetical protein
MSTQAANATAVRTSIVVDAAPDRAFTRTRVELEHRHLERHGEGWEAMRDAVGSSEGWGVGMRRFAAYVGGRPM